MENMLFLLQFEFLAKRNSIVSPRHILYVLRRNTIYFIGMVSHELKIPLTSLNGNIQIMHRKAKAAGNDTSLAAIENSIKQVRQMTTLINGFLNISRLESGKVLIERSCFDYAELCR